MHCATNSSKYLLSDHDPPGDEGDELADTLLHTLPGLLGHLAGVGHDLLHHLGDVVDGQESVLLPKLALPRPVIVLLLLLDDVLLAFHHIDWNMWI